MFGMEMDPSPQKSLVEKTEIYYRRPGREKHESLPEVLDDIIITLKKLESRIEILEAHKWL